MSAGVVSETVTSHGLPRTFPLHLFKEIRFRSISQLKSSFEVFQELCPQFYYYYCICGPHQNGVIRSIGRWHATRLSNILLSVIALLC